MSAYKTSKIFVVGGTGAQGIPVIRGLVKDKKYSCRVLTCDTTSARAKQLVALGNVELITGTFASDKDLREGFRGCDGAFINFYVHGNLNYTYKKSGFDPAFRTGHYDAKGRVSEWILSQTTTGNQDRMGAASFTTGPYIEMAIAARTIFIPTVEDGTVTWRLPLGERGGGVVHVALDDCGHYVRWMFDDSTRVNGQDLEVAIEHVNYHSLAKAFENVTGHPARYIDTSLEEYWSTGNMAAAAKAPSGYNSNLEDPAAMTFQQNFTGFFNTWKHSWGNNAKSVIKRDYKLLDEIHPQRIKSAEEFLRIEEEKGRKQGKGGLWDRVQKQNLKPVLKIAEDGRKGRL